ncbi:MULTISPECIES: DNA-directed RNA polymerase subunit beta' [Aminobacterium]|jgi:DNA-directed RNA polymerase subunit beta'|uniref:DNA-directed RNA polymerase subunit beta' n=1 Tax=Aminobacterium TaxID=81466 RepID=UPI002579560D|nr:MULTISPECIES: DNA-directed RNA polymerase subunit beta' [unclassified Aminobacterium]
MSQKEIVGVRIKLASPERIRELSSGEVKKPETINYRTLRPEKDGLFCERIFGPTKSYECACGKYKRSGPKFKGIVCDRCGVEVTDNRVRRERMGHIELAAPVVHIWYLRGIPSRLSLLLGTSTKDLEKVVYFAPTRKREPAYKIVMEGRRPDLAKRGDVIAESEVKIHSYYDSKIKAEEAYRIVSVDDIPVNVGDVLTAQQVSRYKTEYGDSLFKVEPAFEFVTVPEGLEFTPGDVASASELDRLEKLGLEFETKRAIVNNQETFVVTAAAKLPFAKGDIVSSTEFQMFHEKYPGRFMAQVETVTIEDPCYIVIDKGSSPFDPADIIMEREQHLCAAYDKKFNAGIGAEGVRSLLSKIDLDFLCATLREDVSESTGQKKRKLIKRLQVAEDFRRSHSHVESMVLEVLPVIPPDLRPMVQLDGGRFATSDLNDLYRRVINRNNRLRKLQELRAPEIIIRNEKRMLQESVDALIDNGRMGKAVLGAGNRPLKSLTDLLRGKKGRFRQNLLGKRVDYSGRSVIVIGPQLKIYQCGLPKQMALELFKPFVIRQLVERNLAPNVKSAKRLIERGREEIWGILEEIIKDHPVLLNRAPTLHRLGIQAFEPVLMEGKAIRLHPLVCTAFNADFDGDQMAVHVPLSLEAQAEARLLMLSANNLLSPASGRPIVTPTQDIILGIYYLTDLRDGLKGEGDYFSNIEDVLVALNHKVVHLNAKIRLKKDPAWNVESEDDRWIETSPGRALFNSILPEKLRFMNKQFGKKAIGKLIDEAYDVISRSELVRMLDGIKSLGYHWSTVSGISFGVKSIIIPPEKEEITREAAEEDEELMSEYEMGILTQEEYLFRKEILWSDAARRISDSILDNMAHENPIRMMVDSGARGSKSQMGQMAGIRGLMSDPSGRIIDYPITANFREGMNMLEYFISTHGARKGLADTALRTAKSGYLTRRLVDVAQDIIVTDHDCGTNKGIEIHPLLQDGKVMISLAERIIGRTALYDIYHPETGELLVEAGELIWPQTAETIDKLGISSVWVRSPLTCTLKRGVCQKCYGMDLATRSGVAVGEAVGVVAAQSIGEPGTQLTMRTFHTGGVRMTGEDITQGLPRIEQLFEVRRPKKVAFLAGVDGRVSEIREMEGKRKVIITSNEPGKEEKVTYNIPSSQHLLVEEGQEVNRTDHLTEGNVDPQQLLEVEGIEAVQRSLVDEIQGVYRSQGVSINNKHIEVILRKVAPVNRVRVVEEGDTSFVAGDLVWVDDIEQENGAIRKENEKNIMEATRIFSGRVVKNIVAQRTNDTIAQYTNAPLTEEAIRTLLRPGYQISEMSLEEEGGQDLVLVIGEAAFRKRMEGLELIRPFKSEDGKEILAGTVLTAGQLGIITTGDPVAICVRDKGAIEKLIDGAYLATDIVVDGEVLAQGDRAFAQDVADVCLKYDVPSIKTWHTVERISVLDALQERLMDKIWGRPLSQAIDYEGNALSDVAQLVDARIIRGLVDAEISAVDLEGEILTREKVLLELLNDLVYGKVLLEPVFDKKGQLVMDSGQEINRAMIDLLVQSEAEEFVVRPISARSDEKRLIWNVTFVRKLREGPKCKPFVHGITKAALATDSFLSAASFQQTAQVLAGAAVKGDLDPLEGLKENVIIGHLIPAGTGVEWFKEVEVAPLGKEIKTEQQAPETGESEVSQNSKEA